MKSTSLGLAVLSALAASTVFAVQGAGAQTLDRREPLTTVADGVGGFNADFGDTFAASASGNGFTDIFTFRTGTPFDLASSLTSLYLDSPQTKDLDIIGLNLYRYDPGTLAILGNAISGIDQSGFGQHPVDRWSLTAFGLPAGSYAVRVDGRVSGAAGGVFGADLAIAAVPEPQAWRMLAAGLGLAGVLALRRRR
jgi:hypothetical protein